MNQLWTAAAWLLAAIGLALALWALFSDRAKGRRRCPKCWYDLAGVPTLEPERNADALQTRCPECGHVIRREHHTHRTRRRWRWALASLPIFALAYASLVGPAIIEQGARAAIPTLALLYGPYDLRALAEPDMYPEPTGRIAKAMFDELKRRLDEHRLRGWHTDALQRRLRGAYSRTGRLGVSPSEVSAFDALARTPHTPTGAFSIVEELSQEIRQIDLTLESIEPQKNGVWALEPDPDEPRSLAEALDAGTFDSEWSWTLRDNQVVLGHRRDIALRTRYAVIDLRALAPVQACWRNARYCNWDDSGELVRRVDAVDATDLCTLVESIIDDTEWQSNGGVTSDLCRIDDTLIIRARPSTLLKVERFIGTIRSAREDPTALSPRAELSNQLVSRQSLSVRVYNTAELAIRIAAPIDFDIDDPTQCANAESVQRSMAVSHAIDVICQTIDPDNWDRSGGSGTIIQMRDYMAIATTPANHQQIEQFLSDLKSGRATLPPE